VQECKDHLYNKKEIVFAYLFGSFAKKTENKLSDIDLAIYIDEEKKPESGIFGYKSELIAELQHFFQREIDLVILNQVSADLAFRVLKEGQLLFCKSDKTRTAFHEQTVRKKLDFAPLKKVQREYQKKRISKGQFGR